VLVLLCKVTEGTGVCLFMNTFFCIFSFILVIGIAWKKISLSNGFCLLMERKMVYIKYHFGRELNSLVMIVSLCTCRLFPV